MIVKCRRISFVLKLITVLGAVPMEMAGQSQVMCQWQLESKLPFFKNRSIMKLKSEGSSQPIFCNVCKEIFLQQEECRRWDMKTDFYNKSYKQNRSTV